MSFITYAQYSQDLKSIVREAPMWGSMTDDQREVLEVMAGSLAHIIVNDPNTFSQWDTLFKYSEVIRNKLQSGEKQWQEGSVKTVQATGNRLAPKDKTVPARTG